LQGANHKKKIYRGKAKHAYIAGGQRPIYLKIYYQVKNYHSILQVEKGDTNNIRQDSSILFTIGAFFSNNFIPNLIFSG
jgi:hypothetical protein